jgi:hypothetical protein
MSIRARVVAARSASRCTATANRRGWPAGSARGEPAPSAGCARRRAQQHEVAGAVVGAAACSPQPARPGAAARIAREVTSGARGPQRRGRARRPREQEDDAGRPVHISAGGRRRSSRRRAHRRRDDLGDPRAGGSRRRSVAPPARCGRGRRSAGARASAGRAGVKVAPGWPSSKRITCADGARASSSRPPAPPRRDPDAKRIGRGAPGGGASASSLPCSKPRRSRGRRSACSRRCRRRRAP